MAMDNSTGNPVSSTAVLASYNVTITSAMSNNSSVYDGVTEGMTSLSNVTDGMTSLFENVTVGNASFYDNVTMGNTSLYDNVTDGMTPDSATGASIVSPIVMFLTGLLGNVLALVVLHKSKAEIRNMLFYTLVAALTWNDLLGICLTSPPVLASYLNHRQMPALDTLCPFHALAMVCFGLSTPFIVCTMAIERSLALKCCYFYSKYCTPNAARILVALLWAFVLFFGSLPLFGVGAFTLQYPKTWCFLDFRSYLPLDMAYASAYAILNLLVVVVMIFCNALVMTTLCQVRKTRRMSNASVNSTLLNADAVEEKVRLPPHVRRRHQRDVELQMIWLLCAITTIFSVCWVPLMVYILFCLQSPNNHSPVFGLVAVRLASLNQTLNPWIYVILRKSLLSRVAHLCRSYCRMCRVLLPDKTQQVSVHPRRPTQFHNPRIIYNRQPQRFTDSSKSSAMSSPNHKYVHVRNQLCPSSHFVDRRVGEKPRQVILNSGRSGVKVGKGGKKGSKVTGSGDRYSYDLSSMSLGDQGRRTAGSSQNGAVCSRCQGTVPEHADKHSLPCLHFPHPASAHAQSNVTSPSSSAAVCEWSKEKEEGRPLLPLATTDGIYVDLFPHPPASHISGSDDVTRYDVSTASYRSESGRTEAAAAQVFSFVSEADDHGYGSRVSTDSSRLSTPERTRPDHSLLADRADLTSHNIQTAPFQSSACEPCETDRNPATGVEGICLADLKDNHQSLSGRSQDRYGESDGDGIKETPFGTSISFQNVYDKKNEHLKQPDVHLNNSYETQSKHAAVSRELVDDLKEKQLRPEACTQDTEQSVCNGWQEKLPTSVKNDRLKQSRCCRDDSFDVTSGVFDCRDEDDVFDDDVCGDDGDDDVYDDRVAPVALRREGEESGGGRQGEKRASSSATLSTSSAITRLDSNSALDTATVCGRHCSSSSGH